MIGRLASGRRTAFARQIGRSWSAFYDGRDLAYAGRVGTGFSERRSTICWPGWRRSSARVPLRLRARAEARECTGSSRASSERSRFTEWTAEADSPAVWRGLRPDKQPQKSARALDRSAFESAGRRLRVSNLEKVIYPASGLQQGPGDRLLPAHRPGLLPHLKNRPLTLKRFPTASGRVLLREERAARRACWVRTAKLPSPGSSKSRDRSSTCSPTIWRPSSGRPTSPRSSCTLRCGDWIAKGKPAPPSDGLRPRPRRAGDDRRDAAASPSSSASFSTPTASPRCRRRAVQGPAAVRPAAPRRVPGRTSTCTPPPARRAARARTPGAGRFEHEEGAARRQGPRRLESEQRRQDDGRRLLASRERPTVSTPVSWSEVGGCRRPDDLVFLAGDVLERESSAAICSRPRFGPLARWRPKWRPPRIKRLVAPRHAATLRSPAVLAGTGLLRLALGAGGPPRLVSFSTAAAPGIAE